MPTQQRYCKTKSEIRRRSVVRSVPHHLEKNIQQRNPTRSQSCHPCKCGICLTWTSAILRCGSIKRMGILRWTSCQVCLHAGLAKIRGAGIWQQINGISVAANANTTTRHMASTLAGPKRSIATVVGVCTCPSKLWRV